MREAANVLRATEVLGDTFRTRLARQIEEPPDHPAVARILGDDLQVPPQGIDLKQLERDLMRQALLRTGGNRSRAARLLGLSRHQLRYRLEKLALESGADARFEPT